MHFAVEESQKTRVEAAASMEIAAPNCLAPSVTSYDMNVALEPLESATFEVLDW